MLFVIIIAIITQSESGFSSLPSRIGQKAEPMMTMLMRLLLQGKITAQGKLLLQDTLLVVEQSAKVPRVDKQAMKERRVFLFEQIVIFSEEIDKRKNNMSSPGYIYKNSIKVSSYVSCIKTRLQHEPNLTVPRW